MNCKVRLFSLILAVFMIISLCACDFRNNENPESNTGLPRSDETDGSISSTPSPESVDTSTSESTNEPAELTYTVAASLKDAAVGDIVIFGTYEQDGNEGNGKEPLEWLVLSKEGNSALVITLYAMEQMQFHDSLSTVTWETSSLRAWLNGDFIDTAFSSSERDRIKTTTVVAEKNPEYPNSPAGNDTEDKVFLLSVQEAERYFTDNAKRKCSPTEKLVSTGKFTQSNKPWYAKHNYACNWWLRSPGVYKDIYISYIDKGGNKAGGGQVNFASSDICVRPAIWVNIE